MRFIGFFLISIVSNGHVSTNNFFFQRNLYHVVQHSSVTAHLGSNFMNEIRWPIFHYRIYHLFVAIFFPSIDSNSPSLQQMACIRLIYIYTLVPAPFLRRMCRTCTNCTMTLSAFNANCMPQTFWTCWDRIIVCARSRRFIYVQKKIVQIQHVVCSNGYYLLLCIARLIRLGRTIQLNSKCDL